MAKKKNSVKLRRPTRFHKKGFVIALAISVVAWSGYALYQNRTALLKSTESFIAKAIEAKLEHILVEGVQFTDVDMLHEAIGMEKGDTLVGINLPAMRSRIESLSWVKLATVTRKLPSTLKVEVYEHHPLAKIVVEDDIWIINKKGEQIAHSDKRFDGLPTLTGDNAAIHASSLFMLLSEEVELLNGLRSAAYVGERRWDLGFESGVKVQLPEKNPQHALKILVALDEERKVLEKKNGTVDLRIADRVILRDMK
jgi:cell division protein FtsQ